jgi:hypothetical protein
MFQQLFETAARWSAATDDQVTTLKQFVSPIVGYEVELLQCYSESWMKAGLEPWVQILIHSSKPCQYRTFKLLDHLILCPVRGFCISPDYSDVDGIMPPSKDRYLRMMAVIDEIHKELGLPPPSEEELKERHDYIPDSTMIDFISSKN